MDRLDEPMDFGLMARITGTEQQVIETLAMAAMFQTLSALSAIVWYGLLRQISVNTKVSLSLAKNNFAASAGAI